MSTRDTTVTRRVRIAIDGNEANVGNRVGSNVYAFELITALHSLVAARPEIDVTVLLAHAPQADLPTPRAGWKYLILGPHPLWTQLALPWHLWLHRRDYDVLFTPGHYAPRLSAVPYVSSVMDIAYLHYPEQFRASDRVQLKQWTKYSVAKARKIITISEFTKSEVATHYHRHENDIVVAYPAVEAQPHLPGPAQQKALLKKLRISQPYIIYVGTLQPRKNLVKLIEAFELVQEKAQAAIKPPFQDQRSRRWYSSRVKLVIAGKVGWLADDILQRVAESPYVHDIILTGYIDDTTKQVLLANASCQTLVGLYEGFGIPALEALSVGTVPVVANSSSLPEVVGKAGITVDPRQANDIAAGLWKALTLNPAQRRLYQRAGAKQLQRFDWRASAATVLQTLEQVAHGQ